MPLSHRPHSLPHSSNSSSAPAAAAAGGHHAAASSDLGAFESHLTQRLSSLLPADDPCCFSLSSFNDYMGLLLATQTDLRPLIPSSHAQRKTMDEFLERSVTVLDVCRDIKEQIADVESLQGMLESVAACCLVWKEGQSPCQGQLRRARKLLVQLLAVIRVEKGDDGIHRNMAVRPSFRGMLRDRLSAHYSHEASPAPSSHHSLSPSTSSGHGPSSSGRASPATPHAIAGSNAHSAEVIKALHSLELSLLPPKLTVRDEEECFASALYALNVMSVFFLGIITAAFPSLGIKAHVIGAIHPPSSYGWTAAFLRVQEKVQEDLRARSRRSVVHAGMWELDALFCLIKKLLEFTTPESLPWSADIEEEVRRLLSQFDQHMRDLETELVKFNKHMADFYNRIISARSEVFDILSNASA